MKLNWEDVSELIATQSYKVDTFQDSQLSFGSLINDNLTSFRELAQDRNPDNLQSPKNFITVLNLSGAESDEKKIPKFYHSSLINKTNRLGFAWDFNDERIFKFHKRFSRNLQPPWIIFQKIKARMTKERKEKNFFHKENVSCYVAIFTIFFLLPTFPTSRSWRMRWVELSPRQNNFSI